MFVRSSVSLVVLSLCACSRPSEPSPGSEAATRKAAPKAIESSPAPPAPSPVDPSSPHARDLPEAAPVHPPSDNATQIHASHILIAYKGALHAGPNVTRSKEEAKALADHVDIEARAGADFEALVAKYSDDPSAKSNKGNLGEFTRTGMVKPFTDAAFALMKQEIGVDPVETAFGFHIIKRTE